ncbi:Delta(8)-fatty-acid desaturase 2 [Diplonema papillatum]|nr:Delta(8)-fatty-acid desaturase 2 [Diplonema papillatum]|eukprot:gene18436-28444_t
MGPVYTSEEIAAHFKKNDLWLIAKGNVYDVSDFVSSHPGGEACILKNAGQDVSSDFSFHRDKAFWKRFKIGTVEKDCGCVVS